MRGTGGLLLTLVLTLPWALLRLTAFSGVPAHDHPLTIALLAGFAILGAALLLSWSGEVAQMDVAQALALAFLAFVAVLPEYSVDMYFSWKAGKDPSYADFPVANMTGANRLLIGIGWPAVVAVNWLRKREPALDLGEERRIELGFLLLATLYSLVVPLKGTLSLLDAVVFVTIFVFYIRSAHGAEQVEPELAGPAAAIARLPQRWRRVTVIACFLYAAGVIVLSAEPFAEALVATGRQFHVNEFLLVQWLAPLASESPEFIVAMAFAWKGFASAGMGTLVSSKVNQWTLLVGLIPAVYAASLGAIQPLVLSARQRDELLLTSAQSLFALAVMADLRMAWWEALLLAGLFLGQFAIPSAHGHLMLGVAYLVLTAVLMLASADKRRHVRRMLGSLFARERA